MCVWLFLIQATAVCVRVCECAARLGSAQAQQWAENLEASRLALLFLLLFRFY